MNAAPEPTSVNLTKRSFTKIDRFAIFDLAADVGLKGAERFLLLALVLLADPRSWEVLGTLYELAAHAGMGTTQVRKALGRFAEIGLIAVLKPFGQGAGNQGRLFICACVVLVVPEARVIKGATSRVQKMLALRDHALRSGNAPESLLNYASIASIDANCQEIQPLARERGCEGAREGGVEGEVETEKELWTDDEIPFAEEDHVGARGERDVDHLCRCGLAIAGHPFTTHDPVPVCGVDASSAAVSNQPIQYRGTVSAWVPSDGSPPHDDTDFDRQAGSIDDELSEDAPW